MRLTWEQHALVIARAAALRSEDPYVKVGACAVRHDMSIAGVGYNGAPSGISIDWSNRLERSDRVIHAERNCLRYCKPREIAFVASTISPCPKCLMDIASYNIAKVVYEQQYDKGESSFSLAREFGIELKQVHIDEEVIQLGIDRVQAEKHVIFGVRDRIKKFLCSWCS